MQELQRGAHSLETQPRLGRVPSSPVPRAPRTHLTFLTSPLGSWPPGRRAGSKLEYFRFLGRPGPRLAGLRELSSLLAATGGWSEAHTVLVP